MKKTNLFAIVLLLSALVLSACGGSAPEASSSPAESSAPVSADSSANVADPGSATESMEYFSTDYADATNTRNQLAYGTILLTNSELPISVEQAKAMLPLWQAILALGGDVNTAPEEISAIQTEIISNFTPDQLQFISDAKITNANLYEYYASIGVVVPTPSADSTRVPGAGKTMTDEEKAARRATAEASGEVSGSGQTTKDLLIQKAIETLGSLAG